jgi:hypothetical protein
VSPAVVDAFVDDCAARTATTCTGWSASPRPSAGVVIPASTAELVDGMSAYGD